MGDWWGFSAMPGPSRLALAPTYYLSSSQGSNLYNGLDPSLPWKDLTPLAGKMLPPGTTVKFYAADTFALSGSINLNTRGPGISLAFAGTATDPVVFTAYGQASTQTTGPLSAGSLPVASTQGFASAGAIVVQIQYTTAGTTWTAHTQLSYTSTDATHFLGVTGGNGTVPTGAVVTNQPILSITGDHDGFLVANGGGLTLSRLTIQGDNVIRTGIALAGATIFNRSALHFQADGATGPYGAVRVQDCILKNFANGSGVQFDSANRAYPAGAVGWNGLTITGCEITGNWRGVDTFNYFDGLANNPVQASAQWLQAVVITANNIHHNPGQSLAAGDASGQGVLLKNCAAVQITGNLISTNGVNGSTPSNGGGYGIVLYGCLNVLLSQNQILSQRETAGSLATDGGGVEINAGCCNVILQQNFIADCWGYGFSVTDDSGLSTANVVVRHNLCIANGARPSTQGDYGSFVNGQTETSIIANVSIYHNTLIQAPAATGTFGLIFISQSSASTSNVSYANNILYNSLANATILFSDSQGGISGLTFQGNDWYSAGNTPMVFDWSGHATLGSGAANAAASLSAWLAVATTQEKVSGVTVAQAVDPAFVNATGYSLDTNFRLQAHSGCLGVGLNLFAANAGISGTPYAWDPYGFGVLGLPIGTPVDYFGNAISLVRAPNIGADNGAGV